MLDRDYQVLANFRHTMRCFFRFSEAAAGQMGIMPQQHQALLFIRASRNGPGVAVGDLAEWLHIKPHSATELSNRLQAAQLVERQEDPKDRRRTLISLSPHGLELLERLTQVHREELQQLKEPVRQLLSMLDDSQ